MSTSIEEPTITNLESREATDQEVTASIGWFLEEYPQYSEEALLEVVAEESQEGKNHPQSSGRASAGN